MDSLHSPSWHRVAELRPQLSPQARFHRHEYRGRTWYVVRGPTSGRVHRLSARAYALVGRMNGERTADAAWNLALQSLGDEAPTQDEALGLIGSLYAADLLRCDVAADTRALLLRAEREQSRERWRALHPLSLRLPLFDPDALLSRGLPWVRPLFSKGGALLWCAVVAAGGLAALRHAPEIAAELPALRDPSRWFAIWLAYPGVKALHELGHGFAVKRWGGEVRRVGLLFLVFIPVPYVDASAASVFPEHHRRAIVGAAGIAVELFLAAIACLLWVAIEPGEVRRVALAVMLIGGASSLLFNGNPLLRFDGYYVLCDALSLPRLAPRGAEYLGALARRWILGLREQRLPETAPGEVPWLVGYSVASFVYRLSITLGIALYLAGTFFVAGVALALASVFAQIGLPLLRQIRFALADPGVGERRGRALAGSAGLIAALALILSVPLPLRTRSQGVIWLPERSHVRAGAEGFVVEVMGEPFSRVQRGEPLIRTRDPQIETRVRVLEAQLRERRLRMHAAQERSTVESEIERERVADTEAALARARERAGEVVIRSPADGTFVIAGALEPLGRYLEQGEVVAYVVDLSGAVARVAVTQDDALRVREPGVRAWVRLSYAPGEVFAARIVREVPAASDQLPAAALGTSGGGPIPVDPQDPDGVQTLESVFQFDLSLPESVRLRAAGARVHVRFDHRPEPLAKRGYRALRRLFRKQLGV